MKNLLKATYFATALFFGIVITLMSPSPIEASHTEHRVDMDSRLSGMALENQLWTLVKNHNVDAISELISELFLGGSSQGFTDHSFQVLGLAHLNIDNFSITEIVESQSEDIRITAYHFVATGQTPFDDHRVSVWRKIKHKHHQYFWQLISHSVLN